MSIFNDHITNQDDIILQKFDLRLSDYKDMLVLVEKLSEDRTDLLWNRKVFVPLDVVWKYYVHEGSDDIVKLYGIRDRPTKSDFMKFTETFSHPDIKKLIFRQVTYIDRSVLYPIYEAFNEYWCSRVMQNKNF